MQAQAQPTSSYSNVQAGFSGDGGSRGDRHVQADGAFRAGAVGRSVVVVDAAVSDPEAFLAAVPPGSAVVRLGPSADPLAALLRALDATAPCASLHVVSHGRPGALLLAGGAVDAALLRERRAEVEAAGRRLARPADVFLYGCGVAAGAEGRAFVDALASSLGAGVTASATPTGCGLLGGDWRLEVSAGRPATGRPLFGEREMAGYRGVLAAPPVTDNTGWIDVIKRAGFDPANDPQAGTAGLDLRGDTTNALLQAQSYTDGQGTDYTGFRVLYGGSAPGPYYFIGFDVDNDGALDAFLGAEPSGNGAGVFVYDADPGQANNSPSTTGIVDSNANPRINLANATFGSVAANAGTSHLVVWVPTADLTNAINAKTGAAVTAASPMNYLVFSATQDNSINGDLGGAPTNSNATFASLGVFTSQSLNAPASVPVVAAPANLALAQDTGANAYDGLTSNGAVTGTAPAGATVTLREGSTVLGTATADGSGRWTIAPGTLAQGAHIVEAVATDANGNASAPSATLAYTLDTQAPAVAITSPGGLTNQAAQTVSGTAEPGSTVEVHDGAALLGAAQADGSGAWSVGATLSGDGAHNLTATATDTAGNSGGPASPASAYTLDTTPPAVTAELADDTGASPTDAVTSDGRLEGVGDPGATVTILDGAAVLATAVADGQGYWSVPGPALGLPDGSHTLTASETDVAGNTGTASVALTLDTQAPAVAITSPGGLTNQAAQTVAGTAEPGSTVALSGGSTVLGTVQVGGDGAWSLAVALPGDGAHSLAARATDAAGNHADAAVAYALDTAPPAVTAGLSNDNGVSPTDAVTSDAGLSGMGDPGATVTILDGAAVLATAVADGQGYWNVPGPALGLPDGAHTLAASETDAAGNTGTAAVAFTLDTLPVTPSVSALATNNTAPAVSGAWGGANGGTDTLSVTVAGVTYTAGISSAFQVAGTGWVLQLPGPLADGAYDVTAQAARAGGRSAQATANGALTVDTAAPVVSIGLTRDSNAFDTVGIVRTEALTGTGTPGAVLSFADGGAAIGTAVVGADGAWTFAPPGLDDGARTIVVQETDAAGNTGTASLAFRPIAVPAPVGGDSTTEWRSMDLAELLNGGGKLQLPAGAERAILADGTLSVGSDTNEALLTRMYYGVLGRAPEAEGISWWQHAHDHGVGRAALADGFLHTAEGIATVGGGRTGAEFLQDLYQGVLGRQGEAREIALWTGRLDAGDTRGAVLAGIADSPEARTHWAGVVAEGVWVRDVDAAVVRAAYLAGLGREAEADGLRFWSGALKDGVAPGQIGVWISDSSEFQALHGRQDDTRFVESLYANGLGRQGEAQGVAGWADALQTGAMTRGDVVIAFAQSEEGQHHPYWAL